MILCRWFNSNLGIRKIMLGCYLNSNPKARRAKGCLTIPWDQPFKGLSSLESNLSKFMKCIKKNEKLLH